MPYPVLFTLAMKREEAMSTPTTDDLLINEKVMGRCNHRRFRREVVQGKRASYLKLVCEGCGDSVDVDPDLFNEFPEIQSDYMTASMTPVYSQHLPVARTVIRRLESRGWTSSMRVTNGAIVLSLVKDDLQIRSGPHSQEQKAIVDAVAKLARSALEKI